jgi:hypothetical protein
MKGLNILIVIALVVLIYLNTVEIENLENRIKVLDMKYNYMCLELTSGEANIFKDIEIKKPNIALQEKE